MGKSAESAEKIEAGPEVAGDVIPRIESGKRWLVVRFARPHLCLSWAVAGGGLRLASAVAWHRLMDDAELPPGVDPEAWTADRLAEAGLADAVGLLTAADIRDYAAADVACGDVRARCVVTAGLGNALRAGDPPTVGMEGPAETEYPVGTINMLVWVSEPLAPGAMLEAMALAAEARTLAVYEAGVKSTRTGRPAGGTGTDCIVVACPPAKSPADRGIPYSGKHTVVGHVIGASAEQAVAEALRRAKNRAHPRRRAFTRRTTPGHRKTEPAPEK